MKEIQKREESEGPIEKGEKVKKKGETGLAEEKPARASLTIRRA